jgi:hypothetical protein
MRFVRCQPASESGKVDGRDSILADVGSPVRRTNQNLGLNALGGQ